MARQFNEKDLHLLGYELVTLKHDEPGELSVYDADAKAGADRVMHRFIYLKSGCTQKGAHRAVSYLAEKNPRLAKAYGFKASSLDAPTVIRIVERAGCQFQSHEDLIWQQLDDVFRPYLESLLERMPFIRPFMKTHLKKGLEQHRGEARPPIMRYMQGRDVSDNGKVRILSAHAGVGKTTLARHLVRDLAELCKSKSSRVVPIFVEAHHWDRRDLGEIDGLWGIIKNSLDVFDSSNKCSRHFSATLFRHALRQGYLSFVFDGFDELCGGDDFDADRVLKELAEMARESEARILVTTRTLFWNAQIHTPPENVSVWTLDSFNSQQARGYFREEFEQNSAMTKYAVSLYNSLRKESRTPPEQTGSVRDQFVNLPLCIRMIADIVKTHVTFPATIPSTSSASILQRILLGFCQRELRRIRIVSSPEAQLASFVDRAVDSRHLNPVFDVEDLIHAVDGIKEEDLAQLKTHALLERVPPPSKQYRFRYEFLGPHLRAVAIAEWLTAQPGSAAFGPKHLSRIMRGEADGQGFVLEQLLTLLDSDNVSEVMSRGCELAGDGPAGSFIFHLARELIERRKLPHDEATSVLLAGLSGMSPESWNRVLSKREFHGTLEDLHLAGVKFHYCKFHDVVFRRCVVDSRTEFSRCDFDGDLRFEGGLDQWARVSVASECKMSAQACFAWSDILGGHSASREARIIQILRIGLEKFWYSGQIRPRIKRDDWNKGLLGRTNRAEPLLDLMLKAHLVNTDDHRNRIQFDRNSFSDLQNYMDNDQRSGRIRDLYELLQSDGRV